MKVPTLLSLITRFVRQMRYGRPVVLVSGLPRSGTSMMMKMLESGGMEILTDHRREADSDNPRGYFELEAVKKLGKSSDSSWLEGARGKAVKVVSQLLKELPTKYEYRVIFMERDMREVIASQNKMLGNRGKDLPGQTDEEMSELFQAHLRRVRVWLRHQPNFEVLYVHYAEVLRDPIAQAERIRHFLGSKMNPVEMSRPVDPRLYRNRA